MIKRKAAAENEGRNMKQRKRSSDLCERNDAVLDTNTSIEAGIELPSQPSTVGQAEEQLSGWCETKLAALQRSYQFTQRAEFADADHHAVQTRLEMLESCWGEFGEACRVLSSTSVRSNHTWLEQGEEVYFTTKASLRARLAEIAMPADAQLNRGLDSNVLQIQWSDMPNQERLPTFDGDFAKWVPFRDVFLTEVHNNKKLTNAQRLRRLLSSLEGAAKRAVGEWSVADEDNYHLAWASLQKQYNNHHRTIRAHMQAVSSLVPIRDNSFEDLRDVLDTVRVHRRHLLSLLTTEQLVDHQFLHRIEQLLDSDGRRDWEKSFQVNELPSLEKMFEFLEQRSNCLASLAVTTRVTRPVESNNTLSESRSATRSTMNSTQRSTGTAQSALLNQGNLRTVAQPNEYQRRTTDSRKCFKCEQPGHALFRCEQFKTMSVIDRRELIQKKHLCESCFSPNHSVATCRKDPCPLCPGKKHNSTICPNSNRPKAEGMVIQPNSDGRAQ